jgi:hypothetical protein
MQTTIKQLKNELSEIEFYTRFPTMIPFVGDYYISAQHKKMLLVGESFYFPEKSEIHKNAEIWYHSYQSDLTIIDGEKESEYVNCEGLLNGEWKSPGHKIYRNLNAAIGKVVPCCKQRPINEIAFTNFFLRPAIENGKSFQLDEREGGIDLDLIYSKNVLKDVIDILTPDLIVFVSIYAFKVGSNKLQKLFPDLDIEFVCHPADPFHWQNKNYEHNEDKFLRILKEKFVN